MTYDDDELAAAALLLAYHESQAQADLPSMPGALERKLLAQGRAHASEVRYSTTKAAAVSVEASVQFLPSPASRVSGWVGWLAAAACVAFAVYQWRIASLRVEPPTLARSVPSLEARDASGAGVAELQAGPEGELMIRKLPANVAGEHYRVWTSTSASNEPVPAGSFACAEACSQRAVSGVLLPGTVQGLWITKNKATDAWTRPDEKVTIAEGHRASL